jgi:DNA-binding PadR family transcriptional regulator
MKWIKEIMWFWKVVFTRGKPRLEIEIEIMQLLAARGEVYAMELSEHFNKDFDYDNPKPLVYVSFGLIYSIMGELEEEGVVKSRMAERNGRRRMLWRLTGRGPRRKTRSAKQAFRPAYAEV